MQDFSFVATTQSENIFCSVLVTEQKFCFFVKKKNKVLLFGFRRCPKLHFRVILEIHDSQIESKVIYLTPVQNINSVATIGRSLWKPDTFQFQFTNLRNFLLKITNSGNLEIYRAHKFKFIEEMEISWYWI